MDSTHVNAQMFASGKLTDAEIVEIAKARAKIEAQIDKDACNEGAAVGVVRFKYGVVGRRPGKKRAATSGCSADHRKCHGRLSSATGLPDVYPLAERKPQKVKSFKRSIVIVGWKTKPEPKPAA